MDNYLGKVLGNRYRILELIGVGGMAIVYRAYDSIDDRTVAVKVLKDEFLANEEFRRRFKNESKAIAVLSHPNIVKVFDVNFGEKLQYIIMEYVEGITLKEYIEHQKVIDWREVLHFATQVLRALQHAHDKGIVHRDVKPQNIMLLQNGTIKVTDFGIARFCRGDSRTIAENGPIGSVHYISPEQARGEVTDDKADIYSVGVVLYEMLTGILPFQSDSAVSVAIMQVQSEARRPSEINPSIPGGLEQITLRAMQKNPLERYQSAAEMLLDLDEFKRNPQIKFDYSYFIDTEPTKHIATTSTLPSAISSNIQDEYADDMDEKNYEVTVRNKTVPILTAIMASLIVIIGITAVILYFKTDLFGARRVEAPNCINMMYEEVLLEYPDFDFEKSPEYTTAYEEGIVFAQSPAANTSIKKGTVIKLSVATKGETIEVPNVIDDQFSVAETKLRNLGFEIALVPQYEPDMEEGTVIRTNPEAGKFATYREVIYVFYATNTNENIVTAPDTVGNSLSVAKRQIQTLSLKVGTVKQEPSSPALKDYVISQDPPSGTQLQKNMTINLIVGSGIPASSSVELTITLPELKTGATGNIQVFINNNLSNAFNGVLMDGSAYNLTLTGSNADNAFKVLIDSKLVCEGNVDFTSEPAIISNRVDHALSLLPDVISMEYEKALNKLTSSGFTNVSYELNYNDYTPTGYVYEQIPQKELGYTTGTKITLYVSKGPMPTETTLPETTVPPETTTTPNNQNTTQPSPTTTNSVSATTTTNSSAGNDED